MARAGYITTTITDKTADKLNIIKETYGFKSIPETINYLIGEGFNNNEEFIAEAPAFQLIGDNNINVSWKDLKNSHVGSEWVANSSNYLEKATVLFIDNEGVLIRFIHDENNGEQEVTLKYFHFL